MKILHISEAVGGGVEAAIRDYAVAASDFTHDFVFCRRGEFATGDADGREFSHVRRVDGGVVSLTRTAAQFLRADHYDAIHLHSAWAGLFGRAILCTKVPIIYSPHSYFFDRTDISNVTAVLARIIERILARRAKVTVCVSPWEVEEARRLGANAFYVPNFGRVDQELITDGSLPDHSKRPTYVVGVGRLATQKDPRFFARVRREFEHLVPGSGLTWRWIGGGDERMQRELEDAGVDVVPWLPRRESLKMVKEALAYLHTAAWEGSPLTLLEAEALGVPIVARSIAATESLGFPPDRKTPRDMAVALSGIVAQTPVRTDAAQLLLEQHVRWTTHATALRAAYRQVTL